METFRRTIIYERKLKEITQQEISTQLQVPLSTYASWEQGKSEPSAEMIVKLADIFQVSTDYLLGRTNGLDAVSIQTTLTARQKELLTSFDMLNDTGKANLFGYLSALLVMNDYCK